MRENKRDNKKRKKSLESQGKELTTHVDPDPRTRARSTAMAAPTDALCSIRAISARREAINHDTTPKHHRQD